MHEQNKRYKITVTGKVQGVCFRYFTQTTANEIGLNGYVRNLSNGQQVETVFEGSERQCKEFIEQLHKGPPGARIDRLQLSQEEYMGNFKSFVIKY